MFSRLIYLLFGDSCEGRSPRWREIRDRHVEANPVCVCCGSDREIEVHHLKPVSLYPEEELTPTNLRTCCRRCHRLVGHCDDTRTWNPKFDSDAEYIRTMISQRKNTR